jgi:general secretion pathway protein A
MYDEFYGFTGRPFQLTPDHRFFFNSPGHSRALAYLRYGLEQREGFIVITGGIGTGKTMLVLTLFDELTGRDIVAGQLVTTQVDPEDMLRMVCASFGLSHDGMSKAAMLGQLQGFAKACLSEGRRILLVVDEAQNLPPASLEELRMLSNYQIDGHSLFQSFLLGQEELRSTLQGPGLEQFRQRIIAAHHLEPLTAAETLSYVEYRLACVNWKGSPILQDGVIERIHSNCRGVPRMINALCDRLLLFGCIDERGVLCAADVETVAAELHDEVGGKSARWSRRPDVPAGKHDSSLVEQTGRGGEDTSAVSLALRVAKLEQDVNGLLSLLKASRQLLQTGIQNQSGRLDCDEID